MGSDGVADGVADAPKTTGKLKYELVDGQTAATYVYATYPLKFLHPRGTIRQGFGTYVTVCVCVLLPTVVHGVYSVN